MCSPLIAFAAVAALSAKNAYDTAKVNRGVAEQNAAVAEQKRVDALSRGEQDAMAARRAAGQQAGAQRAGFSARGLDISEGTPADLIDQTDFFGQTDVATARTNARKEAWGYQAQKNGFESAAASSSPGRAAGASLLSSAGSVAANWYAFGGSGGAANQYNYTGDASGSKFSQTGEMIRARH